MENTIVQQIENTTRESVWNTVTYSPLLDSIAAVCAVVIPLCFRSIRDFIINKCKEFVEAHTTQHVPRPSDISAFGSVQKLLAVLLDNTKADRVSIYFLHNGEFLSKGKEVFKFTRHYGEVGPGVTPDNGVIQKLEVTNYLDFIGPMYGDDYMKSGVTRLKRESGKIDNIVPRIIRYNVAAMPYTASRYLFEGLGVDVLYAIPLTDKNGKIIGIINFQYLTESGDVFNTLDKKDICEKIMRIQYILNS